MKHYFYVNLFWSVHRNINNKKETWKYIDWYESTWTGLLKDEVFENVGWNY